MSSNNLLSTQEIGKRTNPKVYRTIKIKKEKHKFE